MMTPGLSDALQALGVKTKIGWRWSHAFIRFQPYGSENVIVREDASAIRPAIVSIGERITSPSVAGAVESIQFQPGIVGK